MHSPSNLEAEYNLLTHSSEPFESFTTGPRPVVLYFTDLVQRLVHDNVDYALATTIGTHSIEAIHAITPRRDIRYGEFVEPYRPLKSDYHVLYHAIDGAAGISRLGLIIANATAKYETGNYVRSKAIRTYTWSSDVAGALYRRDFAHTYRLLTEQPLYGSISDPLALHRSQDEAEATLKHDLMLIKTSEPIKPVSVSRLLRKVALGS